MPTSNMKKILLYIFALALVVSCGKGLDPEIVTPVGFRVVVAGGNSHATKMDVPDTPGSQPGIEDLNENLIKTLDVFFYPHDASNTTAAVYHRFFTPEESSGIWETSLETDDATLKTIFGNPLVNGAEAQVFAVANYYSVTGSGSETTLVSRFSGNETIKTIRETKISADFCKVDANLKGIKETSFVMEGTSIVTLSQRVGYYFIEGEIPLYRSAAKIELAASIPQSVISTGVQDANGNTWKPLVDQMDVILVNGCNKGIISTVIEEYAYDYPAGDEPINFPTGMDQSAWWTTYGHRLTKEDGDTFYEHTVPFYSYPTKLWGNKMPDSASSSF